MKMLILMCFGLFLCSCSNEKTYITTYVYKNTTTSDISVEQWRNNTIKTNLFISPGEAKSLSYSDDGALSLPLLFSDSLRILFGNTKKLLFYPQDHTQARNPLIFDSYDLQNSEKDSATYLYLFTQDQYESAEPYVPAE